MKFQEFLEFFDTGGKISFTYEGKDYEFMRVAHDGNHVAVNDNTNRFIYTAIHCNGICLYVSNGHKGQDVEYPAYLNFLKNLQIGRKLETVINDSLYNKGSLSASHDMDITTLGDVLNRVNAGFDFELYYKDNLFYMCRYGGMNNKKGIDYRVFVYDVEKYSSKVEKDAIVERIQIAATTEHIDSKHKFVMESENLEEYYFFLKNLNVDGVKFTDIIGNKLYTGFFC